MDGITSIYSLDSSDQWIPLEDYGTNLSAAKCSFVQAEECMFITNGNDDNRYITSNGTNVVTSGLSTGHLYNSPKAHKINYYKDKLYVGDYYIGSTRYRNGIMRSSTPLGIVALVDGDHTQPITSLKVTDTKYIHANDSLDIYRGGTKIGDITVTAKTEDTLTISSFATDLLSADEVWINNSYSGTKLFRWADNASSGEDVKQYDTFKLTGGENDALTMMTNIGNVMVIANKKNMAFWNDSQLTSLDLGIGCVSDEGYVKAFGTLFFIGYDGIYTTDGSSVPKLISAKIQSIFDGATKNNLEKAAIGKKGYNIFISLGDITLYNPDKTINRILTNVVIEYNIKQNNWYIHTDINAHFFQNYYTNTDVERLIFCADTGHVYEFLTGDTDDGKEIHFRADTQTLNLSNANSNTFESIAYPYKVIIETEIGTAMQCFVSLDGDPFYEIQGEANRGCSTLFITSPNYDGAPARARNIKLSIRNSSKTPCRIKRLATLFSDEFDEENYRKQAN
jgi:hypothetical protein